jgi:ubiquinone/menaquinone biosynthesis C-methylase UbiE
MRRVVIPELLDSDNGTQQEIREGLSDLRNINRWFGGVQTTQRLIEQVAASSGQKSLSLLEVASGTGDVPLLARDRLVKSGITLKVTLLDRARSHLNGYRPSVASDALSLPFSDASFDIVSCCLFTHHLEQNEMFIFVRESLRVCRTALLINDLRRSALHLVLVYAGMPLFRSRLTRHDAPASARRAYTAAEIMEMAKRGGARRVDMFPSYLFRMGVIAWK